MNPVEEVRSRLDIVDVVSKFVELKRAGRNYKALCPFHAEKTPSFVVFPDTQTWRCFGACSEGGDVYSFMMKKNGWDFGETLRSLAEQTGVELRPRTPEQLQRQEENAKLFDVLNAASLYYANLLRNAPEAEAARSYVAQRGLKAETVELFQVGYSLDQWDSARKYLKSKGFDDDDLLAVGLIVEHDSGRRYDRFRDRLMIPIRDLRGRVLGFGARALAVDATPKYINSPQTDLFDKSTLLYGLDLAKKGIREMGQAIIVEGYMDVMQGHQAGYSNVVAQMGTALTEYQLRQLKRYTGRLTLALDADAAGQSATMRGLDIARQTLDRQVEIVFDPRGLVRHESRLQADIRIATLPEGYDPDKLIKEEPAAWDQLVAGAKPVVEFIIDTITAEVDPNDAKAKSAAVARSAPIIRDVTNAIERDHYTQHLARRLGIDERTLVSMITRPAPQVARRSRRQARIAIPSTAPAPPPNWEESPEPQVKRPADPPAQEIHCLYQILATPDVWRQVDRTLRELGLAPITDQDFSDPQNRAVFSALHETTSADQLDGILDEALLPRLRMIQELRAPRSEQPSEKIASHLVYTVLLMRREATRRTKRELDSTWAEALAAGDESAIGAYGQQVLELKERRLRIDLALGTLNSPILNNQRKET
jgi:DNA primase